MIALSFCIYYDEIIELKIALAINMGVQFLLCRPKLTVVASRPYFTFTKELK
ncbi:hypothetical protein PPHE_a2261 [Pseudoalteromonas phenolica O-BC30]|nr:hypothetical protein [Pseudoalteromonas phenolica O-BC30]